MQKRDTKRPRDIPEILESTQLTLDTGVECLRRRIAALVKTLDGSKKHNVKLNSHLVWLLEKIARVQDSMRQLEKHDRVMTKTPAQRFQLVMAFLRDLAPDQRADVARELAALDSSGSGLLS